MFLRRNRSHLDQRQRVPRRCLHANDSLHRSDLCLCLSPSTWFSSRVVQPRRKLFPIVLWDGVSPRHCDAHGLLLPRAGQATPACGDSRALCDSDLSSYCGRVRILAVTSSTARSATLLPKAWPFVDELARPSYRSRLLSFCRVEELGEGFGCVVFARLLIS